MNNTTPNAESAKYESKGRYVLLALALFFLAIGFSNAGENSILYVGLPVGTILLGLFMIGTVLHKEMELLTLQEKGPAPEAKSLEQKVAQPSLQKIQSCN